MLVTGRQEGSAIAMVWQIEDDLETTDFHHLGELWCVELGIQMVRVQWEVVKIYCLLDAGVVQCASRACLWKVVRV